ncbi:inter-alpha-trypsin inhibitor heavy chain H4-like isoform X2 [Maniola jurtina]|uniref:inter-alpha-trypsin inhibitor heavy chain H4-like isoform X2 n=1 Tax=Maniola jurtina TaxID=191418 RepID=UPI001E68F546|nr:inter-alpha-trypsin inhibitor heavy chain H4-like isoform X2 [Maniola jurtina]
MEPRRLMITLWLGVITASVQSAAVPTQDEYLVVASGHPKVRRSTDDTTDKPLEPIKLTEMRVRSEVALRYARTSVLTHVHNPDARPQEVTFRMLLPDTAFISGFTMIIGGKSYKAYVKEKQEAKQIYTQAVSQGLGAAHIATKARDSNHFTVSTNVEGNTTAVFDLRYEDFLTSRDGFYSHVINLHPGALVPIMEVVVHIKESQKITKLRIPDLRTGNEIDTTKDTQNSKAVIQNGTDEREVTITFTPDLSEQRRLAKIYMEKSKDSSTSLGQFVVEYDVERSNNGEILVNDGYFVHFLAPTALPPLSKHIVFVLDTSWSMAGRKIDQLRIAMNTILSDLNPNDYFSIVEFNSDVKIYEFKEDDDEVHYVTFNELNPSTSLAPPTLASPKNIAKAKVIVSRLQRTGTTDIYSALEAALSLVKKGVEKKIEITNDSAVVNTDENVKKRKELEPIIFFLTDGEPVSGETNTDRITSLITTKNSGDIKAALYSIAFGEGADRAFLRKLSLRNEGFMRHIYEAADAALQLHDFYRQVSSPLLANVKFLYPENQTKEGSVSRSQFRTINAGSEVVVVGQVADDVTEMTPRIVGFRGSEDGQEQYEASSKVVVTRTKDEYLPLERLWAYLTIKQLLDKRDAGEETSVKNSSSEGKALAIALKYGFVTPLTSLVVVKPDETNAVDIESVDSSPYAEEKTTTQQPTYHSYYTPSPQRTFYGYNARHGSLNPVNSRLGNGFSYHSNNIGIGDMNANSVYMGVSDDDYGGSNRGYNGGSFGSYNGGGHISLLSGGYSDHNSGSFDSDYGDNYGSRHLVKDDDDDMMMRISGGNNNYNRMWDSGSGENIVVAPTTTSTTTSTTSTTTTQATTTASSRNYHLGDYKWTTSLLNTSIDALVLLGENGTQIILNLPTDINTPKANGGDTECSNSCTSGVGANQSEQSVCVYLTRCHAARSITADDYQKSYCVVNNRYAGVCCPRNEVDRSTI